MFQRKSNLSFSVPLENGANDAGHDQHVEPGPGDVRYPHIPASVPLTLVEGTGKGSPSPHHEDHSPYSGQTERF